MPELLLELGCEELPANFVEKAAHDLKGHVGRRLAERGIAFREGQGPFMTPRRLIVHWEDVAAEQPGKTEEKRGPSEQAAFDAGGNPAGPLLGFCKSMGVESSQVRREGGYTWVSKSIPGRPTLEVLAEVLPEAIRALTFEKSMRWGNSRMRFARPIRWILASFGGVCVPIDVEGVTAGLESRGHRFFHPEPFGARTLKELLAELRARYVEPDPEVRRKRIVDGAKERASGTPELRPALIEENVYLTEWPEAHEGRFRPEFLELPEPVLVTAMAKHERFFPIRDAQGKVTNGFISIRGGGEEGTVRAGNEWVLNARFNDARFFFEEDKRHSLEGFLEKTSGIVFQESLGTIRQRADRLASLCEGIATATYVANSAAQEVEWARLAGLYAKADLSTGLVSELASLQGIVGGQYALREGLPEPVCDAIAAQYDLERCLALAGASRRTAMRLLIADQIDKLAGYLGIGLAPSGSSDPIGLRRGATQIIEACLGWDGGFPNLKQFLEHAASAYEQQGVNFTTSVVESTSELLANRYEVVLKDVRPDRLAAAIMAPCNLHLDRLEAPALGPQGVLFRTEVLEILAEDRRLVQTATRPINIVADAARKGRDFARLTPIEAIDPATLDSESGTALLKFLQTTGPTASGQAVSRDAGGLAKTLLTLHEPINAFFENTMINVDDVAVRTARLNLANAACDVLAHAGDFSLLVQEG